ncbi:hypothetical protein Pelo_15254 [Pelomyxa schiedti]|nr:hypothetical protein Pelo_15254 [Pelomyxa schiedti]
MLDTQLPCFKPVTIENLTKRFTPPSSTTDAAKFMAGVVASAFSAKGTFFTYFYDKFQQFDNGISICGGGL